MRTTPLLLLLACGTSTDDTSPSVELLPTWEEPAAPECGSRFVADATVLPRAPYLNNVRPDGAIVAFAGPETATAARVSLTDAEGTATSVDAVREAVPGDGDTLALFHAAFTELEPGTPYCYEVTVDGTRVASGLTLTTAVPATHDTTVRFIAIGDFGAGTPEQLAVRDAMAEYIDQTDLFLTLGDNAYGSGTYAEWQTHVFAPNRDLLTEVAYWPTWGNHDYSTDDAAPALANHFLGEQALREDHHERYWSLDHGPLHVIGLDSEGALLDTGDDDQIAWATADLEADTSPWTIALWHKPTFTGHETRTGDFLAGARLQPLVEEHGVDAVLVGHDHFYERFHPVLAGERTAIEDGGLPWIISGGGGRGLYPLEGHEHEAAGAMRHHFLVGEVNQCTLSIEAIGTDGQAFDRMEISRC